MHPGKDALIMMPVPREQERGSLEGRPWVDSGHNYGLQSIQALCEALNVSESFGHVLAARHLIDPEEARRFLDPGPDQEHPPELMWGMPAAVQRLHAALHGFESILVFGDYDVDGTASAAVLYGYLKRLGARVHYHIPHRLEDGYSLSPQSIERVKNWGVDLVITVDHGSTSVEGARALAQAGIDLIITDHHHMGHERPPAVAIVNPQQAECPYPFKGLAAAGVAYKLICALDRYLRDIRYFERKGICHTAPSYFLDLVALATVADMAPLLGENRVLVKQGLAQMNHKPKPWLSGLARECGVRCAITPHIISIKLAPKINALGRVGNPRLGMQLLLTHAHTEARRLSRMLIEVNRMRQIVEREAWESAQAQLHIMPDTPACILLGTDWHPGIIGSIATRIALQVRKPTVVLTLYEQPYASGSARSHNGYDVLGALDTCSDLLVRYGGHSTASGLSLMPKDLESFVIRFNQVIAEDAGNATSQARPLEIEAWIRPEMMGQHFVHEIARLSPFGYRNPEPVLAIRGFVIANPCVFNNRHLRFSVTCPNGHEIDAFAWDHSEWIVHQARRYDIAFMPQIYDGPAGARAQIKVLDVIPWD